MRKQINSQIAIPLGMFLWVILVGCTFRVDEVNPQRIWVGNEAYDWIDLGSIHRLLNGELIILFQDDSPIKNAFLVNRLSCSYLVELENSSWLVESVSARADDYFVTHITPEMKTMLFDYSVQVYPVQASEETP